MSITLTPLEQGIVNWCNAQLSEAPAAWSHQVIGHRARPFVTLTWVGPETSEAPYDDKRPIVVASVAYAEMALRRERFIQIMVETDDVVGTASAMEYAKRLRDTARLDSVFQALLATSNAVIVEALPIVNHPVLHETRHYGSCSFDVLLRYAGVLTEATGEIATVKIPPPT